VDESRDVETTAGTLRNVISRVTQVAPENLEMQLTWTELGLDSILAMQVVQEVESEFGLRLYPNELIEHDTLQKLSAFLVDELRSRPGTQTPKNTSAQEPRLAPPSPERAEVRKSQTTNAPKPLLFILSTPRAGSTLLRVMLAGHHQIFSPPELHLLPFSDFGERTSVLKAKNQQFLEEGLVKALCELKGIAVSEAKAITSSWASEKAPVKEVYQQLQALCPTKLLVDKSPSYAADVSILRKAEGLDGKPFYIHLVRHPLAVMESFVRNRFDRLLSIKEDPWLFAAQLWQAYNENIEKFLLDIPSDRWMRIRYEDLVTQPLSVTRELFLRLGLDFDARVLQPYEGDRMTRGLHGVSLPLADPNFNNHDKIEADLAPVWEEHLDKSPLLSAGAVRLAQRYGYRFTKDARHKLLPAQESFLAKFGDNPVWNIDQFVRLKLDGALDTSRLRACLQHLVAKHSSLRSHF
jgi:acyl carrier protein